MILDPDIPKPTLEEALKKLRHHPDFMVVMEFVEEEREEMIGKFANVVNDGEAMKTAGAVAMADRLLVALRGP